MKMFNEQIQRAFDQGLVFLGRKDYTKKFSDLVYTKDGKFKSSSHAPFETWLPITMNNLSWAIEYVKSDHECKNFIYGMNRDEQDGLIWCAFLMVFWGLDKNHLPDKVVTRKGFYNPAKVWRMFNVYGMSNESHRIQLIKDLTMRNIWLQMKSKNSFLTLNWHTSPSMKPPCLKGTPLNLNRWTV
jgi:hypothetical protein